MLSSFSGHFQAKDEREDVSSTVQSTLSSYGEQSHLFLDIRATLLYCRHPSSVNVRPVSYCSISNS